MVVIAGSDVEALITTAPTMFRVGVTLARTANLIATRVQDMNKRYLFNMSLVVDAPICGLRFEVLLHRQGPRIKHSSIIE